MQTGTDVFIFSNEILEQRTIDFGVVPLLSEMHAIYLFGLNLGRDVGWIYLYVKSASTYRQNLKRHIYLEDTIFSGLFLLQHIQFLVRVTWSNNPIRDFARDNAQRRRHTVSAYKTRFGIKIAQNLRTNRVRGHMPRPEGLKVLRDHLRHTPYFLFRLTRCRLQHQQEKHVCGGRKV